jgi:hypothetical protein
MQFIPSSGGTKITVVKPLLLLLLLLSPSA